MGLTFTEPISADFSIREFALRGEDNAHGWGLAWYPDDRAVAIVKEPLKWRESPFAGFLEKYPHLRSRLYIAHVRHKTVGGPLTHADTHPFSREWSGRDYCFAHNGTLNGFEQLPLGWFRPIGTTDSEHAFCYLMQRIADRGRHLDTMDDWRWLYEELSALNRLGYFNALLSDGHRLFCYHDIKGWKGMTFRKVHLSDHQTRQFGDPSITVELEGESVNHGFVVATRPLSDLGWHDVRRSEMLVLEAGGVQFSSHRSHRSREFTPLSRLLTEEPN